MSGIALEILLILLLLAANGVFAMTEIAVVSARKTRLRRLAEGGDLKAKAALALGFGVDAWPFWSTPAAQAQLHGSVLAEVTSVMDFGIILGALLQVGSNSVIVWILAALSILMASVNIFGGFLVTRRMLAMFRKS